MVIFFGKILEQNLFSGGSSFVDDFFFFKLQLILFVMSHEFFTWNQLNTSPWLVFIHCLANVPHVYMKIKNGNISSHTVMYFILWHSQFSFFIFFQFYSISEKPTTLNSSKNKYHPCHLTKKKKKNPISLGQNNFYLLWEKSTWLHFPLQYKLLWSFVFKPQQNYLEITFKGGFNSHQNTVNNLTLKTIPTQQLSQTNNWSICFFCLML